MTQTIEQLTVRVRELEEENARLKAECDDIKQVQFPRKLEAVAAGWKKRLATAQEEIEQLKATPPDKREDLRCVISDLCRQVRERDAQLASSAQAECEFQRNAHKQAEELMLEQSKQLASAQLNNKLLRDALSAAEETIDIVWVSHHANRCDRALELCRKALSQPSDTSALDSLSPDRTA